MTDTQRRIATWIAVGGGVVALLAVIAWLFVPDAIPSGYEGVEVQGVTVGYPEDWVRVAPEEAGPTVDFAARTPDGEPEAGVRVFVVAGNPRSGSIEDVVATRRQQTQSQLSSVEFTGERAIRVPGADQAMVLDYTFEEELGSGRGRDLLATVGNGTGVLVEVSGVVEALDGDVARTIIDTVRIAEDAGNAGG